jgi:hypothetical protein
MLGCGAASSALRLNPERVTIENVLLKHDEIKFQRHGSVRRRSVQHLSRSPSPGPQAPFALATLAEYYFEPPSAPSRNGSLSVSRQSSYRYVILSVCTSSPVPLPDPMQAYLAL